MSNPKLCPLCTRPIVDHTFRQLSELSCRIEDGIFPHECEDESCTRIVQFDDEPYCFTHSPDEGSSIRGYSARKKALEE